MIVIPMAGMSARFTKAGFKVPKYMLNAKGLSLFEHAVLSFEYYFKFEKFVFIIRDLANTKAFVMEKAKKLGIKHIEIITLAEPTRGQAETVFLGLASLSLMSSSLAKEPITIFNIDTFRPHFIYPNDIDLTKSHYLEVFKGNGENWSFVKPKAHNLTCVIETAEKEAISNLCCTGLYHFASKQAFDDAYLFYLNHPQLWHKNELYIAPIYNYLIKQNEPVHYHLIKRNEVIFCGVPDEYEAFKHDS